MKRRAWRRAGVALAGERCHHRRSTWPSSSVTFETAGNAPTQQPGCKLAPCFDRQESGLSPCTFTHFALLRIDSPSMHSTDPSVLLDCSSGLLFSPFFGCSPTGAFTDCRSGRLLLNNWIWRPDGRAAVGAPAVYLSLPTERAHGLPTRRRFCQSCALKRQVAHVHLHTFAFSLPLPSLLPSSAVLAPASASAAAAVPADSFCLSPLSVSLPSVCLSLSLSGRPARNRHPLASAAILRLGTLSLFTYRSICPFAC